MQRFIPVVLVGALVILAVIIVAAMLMPGLCPTFGHASSQPLRHPDGSIDVVFVLDSTMVPNGKPQPTIKDFNELTEVKALVKAVTAAVGVTNAAKMSFQVAPVMGSLERKPKCPQGVLMPEASLPTGADVVILLHQHKGYGDCAWGNRATAEISSVGEVLHEMGHAAFGLPDEYCCTGAYFEVQHVLKDVSNAAVTSQSGASVADTGTTNDLQVIKAESEAAFGGGKSWRRLESGEANSNDVMGTLAVRKYGSGDLKRIDEIMKELQAGWGWLGVADPTAPAATATP